MAAPASNVCVRFIKISCENSPPFNYKEETLSNTVQALPIDTYTLNPHELDLKRTHVCVWHTEQLNDRVRKIFDHFENTFFPPTSSKAAEFDVATYLLSCKTPPNSSIDPANCTMAHLMSFPANPGYEVCLNVIAKANGMQVGHESQEWYERAGSSSRIIRTVMPKHDNLLVLNILPEKLPASDTDFKTSKK